jgi:hypothetical protein
MERCHPGTSGRNPFSGFGQWFGRVLQGPAQRNRAGCSLAFLSTQILTQQWPNPLPIEALKIFEKIQTDIGTTITTRKSFFLLVSSARKGKPCLQRIFTGCEARHSPLQSKFTWSCLPRSLQTRTVPSRDAEKSSFAALGKRRSFTHPMWPSCRLSSFPESASHT